jgi:hypothetical protein
MVALLIYPNGLLRRNFMSESTETPIVNDAITSDDAGFSSDAGDQVIEDSFESEEVSEVSEDGEAIEASQENVQAETTEELKEEIQEAIEEGASKEEVQNMIREFTVKVNGKEKNVKIDLSDEDALLRKIQMAEAAQIAMQEKSSYEKQMAELERRFLEDPFGLMEEAGLDPLGKAEERIKQEIEERKKSPELREKERIEKELQQAREELKRREEEAENAYRQQLEVEAAAELDSEISAALDAHPTLPRTEGTIARIAESMLWAYDNAEELGIDPDKIKVEHVIPTVENEIKSEIQALLNHLPEDGVEELLGNQILEKMRKKRLNSIKPNNVNNIKPTTKSVEKKEESKGQQKKRAKDYFRNL